MTTAVHAGRIFADEDMAGPVLLPVAGGIAAVFSARGPGTTGANEDAAGVFAAGADGAVLAVADGLGGQPGGAAASRIAMDCLEQAIARAAGAESPVRAAILDGLEQANAKVMELGIGAATTFAALETHADRLRAYHVGDSSILVVGQRGKIKLQTIAHSPVGYAVESGLMDEQEALHHDDRHLISNMVGAEDMRIEVGSYLALGPRDTALVATDGLFDNLGLREVVECVRTKPLEQVALLVADLCGRRMRRPAEGRPSKPDDLTFVLYRRQS
jgi:serine/threonine protein phosphatase PrpC